MSALGFEIQLYELREEKDVTGLLRKQKAGRMKEVENVSRAQHMSPVMVGESKFARITSCVQGSSWI